MNTLDQFFENIAKVLQSKFDDCQYPVYRGHSDGSYNLVLTLLRDYSKTGKDVWTLENNLYNDFRALVGPRVQFSSSWETVFAMRHEGIPTRLLDWTENIGTAIFFALDAKTVSNPHIWILDPYKLNDRNSSFKAALVNPEEDLLEYHKSYADYCNNPFACHDLPIAVYPRRSNERIFAQRGLFTIHGKDERSLDALSPGCLERIDLTVELIPKLRDVLGQFGINKYSVYPDFKGLGDYLKDQYKY
jgi:hypothetical protein